MMEVIDLSRNRHRLGECSVRTDLTWCPTCGRQAYLNTIIKMIKLVPNPRVIELDSEAYHGIRMELEPCQVIDEESAIYVPARRVKSWNGGTLFGITVRLVDRDGMRVL